MTTTLDGNSLFDEEDLQIEMASSTRTSMERTMPGLDGALSIDLGLRPRKIRHIGTLRAPSRSTMRSRISAITAFIDGDTHTLVTTDGQEHAGLRMDTFKQTEEHTGGPGIVVHYEIVYTQLGA